MSTKSRLLLSILGLLGLSLTALGQGIDPAPTVNYVIENEACQTVGGGSPQTCGSCSSSVIAAANPPCTSSQQCVGVQCAASDTQFSACTSGSNGAGNCGGTGSAKMTGCTSCNNFIPASALCADGGTCSSPGCAITGTPTTSPTLVTCGS